ncbi:MAG: hypothetical protein GX987_08365 [Tissierellia bacterium]|nr:hypothetical protein [Tissierellia bacterium]
MAVYRRKISKDVDIKNISNSDLDAAIRQVGRDMIYNYLLFGKDIVYDEFIKNLKIYLKMIDRIS